MSGKSTKAFDDADLEFSFCTIEDVEDYLRTSIPNGLLTYTKRKMVATSDVLRRLYRGEGKDLDKLVDDDALTKRQVKETVATVVAIDVKRTKESSDSSGNDLSAFQQFTQAAGGYSFSGTWRGNQEDVFFTKNQLKNLGIGISTIRRLKI